MIKLTRIESMSHAHVEKLKKVGIFSVEELLEHGSTPDARAELSRNTKISERLIFRWVKHADLFRIKGIAGHKAELLEAVGVESMPELAQAEPEFVYNEMKKVNQRKNLVQRVPGMVQIRRWVKTAKKMPEVVR